MDFNASPVDVFVATKLVYVATLQLTCVSLGFVVGKDKNIGFDGYIGTLILRIYRIYRRYIGYIRDISVDIFT